MNLYQIVEGCKLGPRSADKMKIASHFEYKKYPTYMSVGLVEETHLIKVLANNYEAGIPSFIHECFDIDAFSLVFDIDGEPGSKKLEDILKPMYAAVREIFETQDDSIFNCVVFTASSESKMSYHIHWPDIIVNKSIMTRVYNTVFRNDNSMRDFIDYQVCQNLKLRMAFSDKWDKETGGEAGRKLHYAGAYNSNGLAGRRYSPDWENDYFELLLKAKVRRADGTPLSTLVKKDNTLESVVTTQLQPIDFDFTPYDQKNFEDMPPEFYTVAKMQYVITYLQNTYRTDQILLFDRIVTYMNNFVSMITDHPGKTIFVIKKYIPDGGRQQWKFIQKGQRDFLQILEHIKCKIESTTRNKKGEEEVKHLTSTIGQIWMTHPNRKSYSSIIFNPKPSASSQNDLNLYQGLKITIEDCESELSNINYKERIKPILSHIYEVWCNSDDEVYHYVIRWIAHATLRPWVKLGTALVLVGGEGCGKSMVVDAIGKVFGSHYLHIMDMEDMLGKFCSILEDKLLVFADEAFWGGCKSLAGKLKGMITEEQIRCEHKGFDTYYVDNYTNYIIASNNSHAVPAGENARRWVCLGCSNRYQGNNDYFKNLRSSLYDDNMLGVKCLLLYFQKEIEFGEWVPQRVPVTNLLRAQKANSYDSIELFWDAALNRKYIIPWNEYAYIDPDMDKGCTLYGKKYDYQIFPFQKLYSIYKDEMQGQMGRIYAIQRFKQYMKDKEFFCKIDTPEFAECKKEMWICCNFIKCRELWKRAHCDPNMQFDV